MWKIFLFQFIVFQGKPAGIVIFTLMLLSLSLSLFWQTLENGGDTSTREFIPYTPSHPANKHKSIANFHNDDGKHFDDNDDVDGDDSDIDVDSDG